MEFRWIAALTLWTLLSGPILVRPYMFAPLGADNTKVRKATVVTTTRPVPHRLTPAKATPPRQLPAAAEVVD